MSRYNIENSVNNTWFCIVLHNVMDSKFETRSALTKDSPERF